MKLITTVLYIDVASSLYFCDRIIVIWIILSICISYCSFDSKKYYKFMVEWLYITKLQTVGVSIHENKMCELKKTKSFFEIHQNFRH